MGFQKPKAPSDIARLLGQLRNYIYRKHLTFKHSINQGRLELAMSTTNGVATPNIRGA